MNNEISPKDKLDALLTEAMAYHGEAPPERVVMQARWAMEKSTRQTVANVSRKLPWVGILLGAGECAAVAAITLMLPAHTILSAVILLTAGVYAVSLLGLSVSAKALMRYI